jgi:hypothetical protein
VQADLGLQVTAVMSDKQSGLLPAVAEVFPQARHAFCQSHYLRNIAIPVAEAGEAMKVRLRQTCPPKPDPSRMLQIRKKETVNAKKTTLFN